MLLKRKAAASREMVLFCLIFRFIFILKSRGYRRKMPVLEPLRVFITLVFVRSCKLCSAETLLTWSFVARSPPLVATRYFLGRAAADAACSGFSMPRGPSHLPGNPGGFSGTFRLTRSVFIFCGPLLPPVSPLTLPAFGCFLSPFLSGAAVGSRCRRRGRLRPPRGSAGGTPGSPGPTDCARPPCLY